MDWMYLFYFLLAGLIFWGARYAGRGEWNEDYTSLKQTKILQGVAALGIALHHMSQKTCAPWHPSAFVVHGMDPFIPMGYMLVGVFLFCSGLGLYKSFQSKPDYLKGFFRRRVLPIVIAFYLSEFLHTGVRLLMGEKMDLIKILWYLSGLHMANVNAWYAIVIPFFYLAFWAAFRFCKKEGTAIFWVFVFALGYTVAGAFIDHQDDWWMRGEWWYNSIILFPLGLLFGKHEKRVTGFLKKGYWFWLIVSFAAFFLLFQQSEWLINNRWGYYGEWGDPLKVVHRLMSAGIQWLVAFIFVACGFLMMMKVRFGNKALAWLGTVTLDFYLIHGIFVELFGYNFLDISKSLYYIRKVPLYIAAVLACTVPAVILFRLIRTALTGCFLKKGGQGPKDSGEDGLTRKQRRKQRKAELAEKKERYGKVAVPVLASLLLLGVYLILPGRSNERVRVMNGLEFQIPEHFVRGYTDTRYVIWKYEGTDKKPATLILDAEIRDGKARHLKTAEEVLEACDWMTETELYVNPQGVRMARGFAEFPDGRERRYYIESKEAVILMCMKENEQYYNAKDCEEILLQVADSVRRVN